MTARSHRSGSSRLLVSVLVLISLLVVPVTAPPPVAAASLKDQIAAAKKRQESLTKSINKSQRLVEGLKRDQASTRDAITKTQDELKDIRANQEAVKKRIENVKERLDRIEERHAELVDELRQTDFTLGLLEQELASGEADLKARREAFGRRLAEAYRAENTTLLEQVFTAESFSDALSETSAYLSYGEQDAQLANQISQDIQALDSLRLLTTSTRLRTDLLRRDTLETQAKVEGLRRDLRDARKRLAKLERATERARDRMQDRMQAIIHTKAQVRKAIAAQQVQRQKLRNKINSLVASAQSKATARFGVRAGTGGGRFVWPTTGGISQPYGCTGYYINPPRGSCAHFHDGIDIANAPGTPIVAAADGVVAFVGFNPWEAVPAYIIVIAHGGSLSTLYAHMQPIKLVSVGQVVRKGQKIALMGSTGGNFGSHLHFEVWLGGDWNPVSPYNYL